MVSRIWPLAAALFISVAVAAGATPPPGMVLIPAGTFAMGTDRGMAYEGPVHHVTVAAFYMDRTEVTNRAFARFVKATRYVTESERQGFSGVFDPATGKWGAVHGADWRHPEGPASSLDGRWEHPVVHVSWDDAVAYAKWAGKRLPTEAEWEHAARGRREGALYVWGDDLKPGGRFQANTWQGDFPEHDRGEDGFTRVAPVGSFRPNDFGLYDMAGNVWEWTADWFAPYSEDGDGATNPSGPSEGTEKSIRGGSWLCAPNYCAGYRVGARQKTPRDSGLNNLGFRCVRSVTP
jgi:formylglycine-generating enzyme required for sulfatase activity